MPSATAPSEPSVRTDSARRKRLAALALSGGVALVVLAGCVGGDARARGDRSVDPAAAVERLAAMNELSDALVDADAAFDAAWAGGDAGWAVIGAAADESHAIIARAREAFAAARRPHRSDPAHDELEALADVFEAAAAATLACVAIVERSVREESAETYYTSFPCFQSSNAALSAARNDLQRLTELFGLRRDL